MERLLLADGLDNLSEKASGEILSELWEICEQVEMGQEVHSWQKVMCEQRHEGGKDRLHSRIGNPKAEARWVERSSPSSPGPAYGWHLVKAFSFAHSQFLMLQMANIYLPTPQGSCEYKMHVKMPDKPQKAVQASFYG